MDMIKGLILALLITTAAGAGAAETIDINTADKATLMMVKGVGERRAEAIISYREQFGPFDSVEELMEIEGIGPATINANRDILTVSGQLDMAAQ